MPIVAKVVVGLLAAFGALQLAGLLFLMAGGATGYVAPCSVYPVMDVPSPGGGARATVENRRCGDRDRRTDVSVSANGLASDWSQTVFSAPSAIANAGSYAPLQLRLTWLDDTHLEIRYPRGVKNDMREGRVGDVHINYTEVEGPLP